MYSNNAFKCNNFYFIYYTFKKDKKMDSFFEGLICIVLYVVAAIISAKYLNTIVLNKKFDTVRTIILGILFGSFLIPAAGILFIIRMILKFFKWVFKIQ